MFLLRVLLFVASSLLAWCCEPQDFGKGATACRCSLDNCAPIQALVMPKLGEVHGYVSSKTGDRLKHYQVDTNGSNDHADLSITIGANAKTRQKIIGFGGAFTDATGINVAKLPERLQKQVLQDYFHPDQGIGYTVGRVPIGGSDFSTFAYSYDDHENDDSLDKFALRSEDHDYKIPYMKMAREMGGGQVKFFGSPWSPPAWMKTNKEFNHGGFLIGEPGQKYYKIWAKYFSKFVKEYEKQGVPMWGVTLENEPGAGDDPHYSWNCLGLNATQARDFLKLDLAPELSLAGLTPDKLAVMIHDDQLPRVTKYATTVLQDREAAKWVAGIAFHWYENNQGKRQDLDDLAERFADKFIMSTEACEEWKGQKEHVSLGDWRTFDRYALDIMKDLNHWTSGWIDWNLALDLMGGPNWVGNYVDAPIIVNTTDGTYYRQPFFYALAHFSKFLQPGSVYLESQTEVAGQLAERVSSTVFRRPDNKTVVIVLNTGDTPVNVQVKHHSILFTHTIQPNALHNFIL